MYQPFEAGEIDTPKTPTFLKILYFMNLTELILQQNITVSLTSEQLSEFANWILTGAKNIYETKKAPEQYLTRKQTANMLDVDLSTLWRWNNENYLNTIEIGGKRRYKLSDINHILKKEVVL